MALTSSLMAVTVTGALAFIMIPIILISAQESMRLVPQLLREGALALGVPRWRVIQRVAIPAAYRALVTGLVIAIARALGETAPLLFTAFNNRFWLEGLDQPTATIPVNIYVYAISPFPEWHDQAWAGAFVLLAMVLVGNVIARTLWARRARFMRGG
jgi:phosphate transport system permease protein